MLKQRVITALVLLGILLPAVLYPSFIPFGVVSLILIAACGWEWGRLNGAGATGAWVMGLGCAVACGGAWSAGALLLELPSLWLAVGAFWVLAGSWLLHSGVAAWGKIPAWFRLGGGLVALVVAWIAVMQARIASVNFLFSVLALVWVADIAAYFAGKAMGGRLFRRRLAPGISPGKTWEGALGGMMGVVLLSLLWVAGDASLGDHPPSLYTVLAQRGLAWMVVCVLFLGAMSVVGDLAESLFKRSAGVKDSSGLLPGHGGVLDRLDALLPTLPLALMLTSWGGA